MLLGIAAIVCAVAYTGGPFPLAYLGLGEVFVFLFFGLAAVAGTAYIQTGNLTALALATSVPVGALAVGILIVNNLRDINTDRAAGKRTIAVRIGERRTQWEYGLMLVIAGAAPIVFWIVGWLNWSCVLTIIWWPFAAGLWNQITSRSGRELNPTLGNTGRGPALLQPGIGCRARDQSVGWVGCWRLTTDFAKGRTTESTTSGRGQTLFPVDSGPPVRNG